MIDSNSKKIFFKLWVFYKSMHAPRLVFLMNWPHWNSQHHFYAINICINVLSYFQQTLTLIYYFFLLVLKEVHGYSKYCTHRHFVLFIFLCEYYISQIFLYCHFNIIFNLLEGPQKPLLLSLYVKDFLLIITFRIYSKHHHAYQ